MAQKRLSLPGGSWTTCQAIEKERRRMFIHLYTSDGQHMSEKFCCQRLGHAENRVTATNSVSLLRSVLLSKWSVRYILLINSNTSRACVGLAKLSWVRLGQSVAHRDIKYISTISQGLADRNVPVCTGKFSKWAAEHFSRCFHNQRPLQYTHRFL